MESTGGLKCGWTLATNWAVSGGSLGNSITIESSDSPLDEASLSSAPKSPLILSPPPSAAPSPCEITVNFSQKYEVRQVYVRSTSRVYEIYYSSKQKDDNEYLCTVRCGIAAKSEVPVMRCTGEPSSTCLRDSNEGLDEERYKEDSSNSNDDGWVQVKAPNSPEVTAGCTSLPAKNYINMDFYEATAEISDAEPCVSLTLRLLSIQSGGYVYIDEVYVFVDPVDPNSEVQENKAENTAGSTLLSMLVPSLLQLSKSKGTSLLPEKGSSDSHDHQKQTPTGTELNEQDKLSEDSTRVPVSGLNEQGVKSIVAKPRAVLPVVEPSHGTSQNPPTEKKADAAYGHIETVLEQLVSRVGRIEDLFMRFEENMLKPITSIEARLQHVEHQLEALNAKTLDSRERSGKRFSAPEYSVNDSSINSTYGNESELYDHGELEPDRKECPEKSSVPPEDDASDSESSGRLTPCLTITAPEFSHGDEEEEENRVEETQAVVDSPTVKRQAVSIDDALASALAGFLSSTSALAVKVPELSNKDENYKENASFRIQVDADMDSSVCFDAPNEMTLSKISSSGDVDYEDPLKEIGIENNDPVQPGKEEKLIEARGTVDDEASTETSSILVPDEREDFSKLQQIKSSFRHVLEEPTNCANSDPTACEVLQKDPEEDILHDMLALSESAHTLDFDTPILEVKFSPDQNGTSKSALKALLGDPPETDIAVPCDEGTHEASSSQDQCNFIELGDENLSVPAANGCFPVDVEYCSLQDVLIDPDSEKPQDDRTPHLSEDLSGSLI